MPVINKQYCWVPVTDVVLVWTRLDLARLTVYTRVHIFWYWAIVIRCIFTVIRRLRTGTTIIGARRSKGHTNPANLANLAEREESRSRSLCLSNVELSKITGFELGFDHWGTICPLGRFLKGQFQLQCEIGAMARPGSNPGKITDENKMPIYFTF